MLPVPNRRLLAAVLLACVVAACDDEPVVTPPTTPTPTVTETFSGTVSQSGGTTHSFSVSVGGTVTATLKTVAPDSTLVVGFSMGNWNSVSSTCSIVLANDFATQGAVLTGGLTGAANLCVRVYDVGNVQAGTTVSYSIEVVHP